MLATGGNSVLMDMNTFAWASRKPITLEQATLVAKQFGVSIDEITHAREIVS